MNDLSGRSKSCQSETKTCSFLKSATALLILILVVTVLLLTVAGPIGESLDRKDAADHVKESPLAKEMKGSIDHFKQQQTNQILRQGDIK